VCISSKIAPKSVALLRARLEGDHPARQFTKVCAAFRRVVRRSQRIHRVIERQKGRS
jgi:hypothetical protein